MVSRWCETKTEVLRKLQDWLFADKNCLWTVFCFCAGRSTNCDCLVRSALPRCIPGSLHVCLKFLTGLRLETSSPSALSRHSSAPSWNAHIGAWCVWYMDAGLISNKRALLGIKHFAVCNAVNLAVPRVTSLTPAAFFLLTQSCASAVYAMLWCLCVSVTNWMDRAGFWHRGYCPLILQCTKGEFGYLQKTRVPLFGSLSQTQNLDDFSFFTAACQLSQVLSA